MQLALIDPDPPPDWTLTEQQRDAGLRGVAAARAALHAATKKPDPTPDPQPEEEEETTTDD